MRRKMNEKFAVALKQIALLGGINDYIAISSRELGSRLRISQQSASKRILEPEGPGCPEAAHQAYQEGSGRLAFGILGIPEDIRAA